MSEFGYNFEIVNTAAEAADAAIAFNRAAPADAFENRLLDALDVGFVDKARMWAESWSGSTALLRSHIETKSPEETLDAFSEADPSLERLMNSIKEHPELATAFHKALYKDETVITGLQKIMANEDADGLTLEELERYIADPGIEGQMLRNELTRALNLVADTDVGFEHLEGMASQAKQMTQLKDMYHLFLNDGDEFIRQMFAEGGMLARLPPEMQTMLAGLMSKFMPMLQGLATDLPDPNGFMWGPYTEFGNKHFNPVDLRERGATILSGSSEVEITPAQQRQNDISAQGNAPGAMQGNATGSEPPVTGVGEGPNPNGSTANAQRDAANNNGQPQTPETDPALAEQYRLHGQARAVGMGMDLGGN